MIKKGDIYYKAYLGLESSISENCSLDIEEWHVTKINAVGIYLTEKIDGVTWGKLSTKHGDFGFLPNINGAYFKKMITNDVNKIIVGERLVSQGFFKTKIAAFRSIKPIVEKKSKELIRLLNKVNKAIKK